MKNKFSLINVVIVILYLAMIGALFAVKKFCSSPIAALGMIGILMLVTMGISIFYRMHVQKETSNEIISKLRTLLRYLWFPIFIGLLLIIGIPLTKQKYLYTLIPIIASLLVGYAIFITIWRNKRSK